MDSDATGTRTSDIIGLGVDPGGVHVGVSMWVGYHCTKAYEFSPAEYAKYINQCLTQKVVNIQRIAIEGFWLRSGQATHQIGSEFGTAELIGLTKHLAEFYGVPLQVVNPSDTKASIARMNAVKFNPARGNGGHAKDAVAVYMAGFSISVRDLVR